MEILSTPPPPTAAEAAMDPSPLPLNPNPNPSSSSSSTYRISGVPVEFPYKPYGSQLAFMGRVISTLDRARRNGHSHALLESPTGTGKSLSLLCSSLAWQQHQRHRPAAAPQPLDPLAHGGGFVPEPSGNAEQQVPATTAKSARAKRRLICPTIYYASRTHSQISQVVREYRKTSYRVPMAILASRKHYCTNKHVCMKENVDEKCKLLLKDTSCSEFKNAHKVKGHYSLQKGGEHEVHDIEDLVNVGKTVKGCSYFAAQAMAEEAQLVFCPYNYIINPIVRRAMDIDIKGSIIILDEAHNIEDIARDAGSLDVEDEVLYTLQTELGQLCMVDSVAAIYQPLYDMIQGIVSWISDRKNNLQKREFEHYESNWTGEKAVIELQQAGITRQCFPVLHDCAAQAIKAVSETESGGVHLSGTSANKLEGLFSSLSYFFSGNGCNVLNYQLVLRRYVKRETNNAASGWTCAVSLWCLNPAVVFRDIANLSLTVILTSGTLSPMGSFTSELGVQFEACMEAPHVIDVESQLWASIMSSGPGNCMLNSSYKTADSFGFQDSLGASLEEICKVVPGGALVFFPSYKLLEKLRQRWSQTGQWSRLNAQKTIFVEPRGKVDEFESALRGYYESVSGKKRTVRGKTKNGQKQLSKYSSTKDSPESAASGGAAFLAVCRGKVSEGIDFSDENARVVVIVGIPFPNKNDMQVILKKNYNDTYKSSKGLLSGSEWYCQQAFRALNQAAGRCIRHRFDYGAIIFLDERFKEQRNLQYISKWLRNSIKQYDSFDESMQGLRNFFLKKQVNNRFRDALSNELIKTDINKETFPSPDHNFSNQISRKRNPKNKKLNSQNGKKMIFDYMKNQSNKLDKSCPFTDGSNLVAPLQSPVIGKAKTEVTEDRPLENDSDCVYGLDNTSAISRCLGSISVASPRSALDQSLVINNIVEGDTTPFPTIVQTCDQFPDGPSLSNKISSEGVSTSSITPKRLLYVDHSETEQESCLTTSVNSCNQKKRRLETSNQKSPVQMDCFNSPKAESCCHFDCGTGRNACRDTDQVTESPTPPELSVEKNLHICCLSCKSCLGLLQNNFLVPCLSTSSSKVYLSSALKYGSTSTNSSECLSSTSPTDIHIVVADVSSVDQSIFNRCIDGDSHRDIWSEGDGCVFRNVYCPACIISKTCLGVQVKAADASNLHLLNKVLFFADRIDVLNDKTPVEEAVLPGANVLGSGSDSFAIEKFAYLPLQDPASLSTRSKLRLPKRELKRELTSLSGCPDMNSRQFCL